jgi:hypothetical protein
MTQAAKWRLRFDSETRDLVRRQVIGDHFDKSIPFDFGEIQTSI